MRHEVLSIIIQKSYRILALAAILFASALFLTMRMGGRIHTGDVGGILGETGPGEMESAPPAVVPASSPLPPPKAFAHFFYDPAGRGSVEVAITCRAFYFAILVFPADVDYRLNPRAARINRALPCSGRQEFTETVDLGAYQLAKGEYYLVRAHQDAAGTWYQPY